MGGSRVKNSVNVALSTITSMKTRESKVLSRKESEDRLHEVGEDTLRPDPVSSRTVIAFGGPKRAGSMSSNGSERLIIKKQVDWAVESQAPSRAQSRSDS